MDPIASIVAEPATSVPEVIEKMTDINAVLPERDGVVAFNRMYLAVTDAITGGFFASSEFLERLDVVFANHYFDALRLIVAGERAPRCWSVLYQHRESDRIHPLQFAFAGMNAHINHDLVISVVETLAEFGRRPDPPSHADYSRVNTLLGELESGIRRSFMSGIPESLEHLLAPVEDRVACWSISGARAAAWLDAETLWHVADHHVARHRYVALLDDTVALAAECLLAPTRRHHGEPHPCCGHESVFAARLHALEAAV